MQLNINIDARTAEVICTIVLSYNEWTIEVVYEDEPTSVYKYTLRDGSIVESGVSGTTDKEDLKH